VRRFPSARQPAHNNHLALMPLLRQIVPLPKIIPCEKKTPEAK
jgi:hypothetical protein